MLGRLGIESLAAVGYATQFFMLAQSLLHAIGTVCVALVARAIGAGVLRRARSSVAACLTLAFALVLAMLAPVMLIPETLLGLLNAPPAIIALSVPYFQLTLGSSLLLAISFIFESAFRAAKDTRTPLWIAFWVTLVKVVLNAVLIFGLFGFPRLELVGAGLATVVAQIVAVLLFVAAGRRGASREILHIRLEDLRGLGSIFRDVVRIATPAVVERMAMHVAILSYFVILSDYGPMAVAVYTVGVRVLSFSWVPGIGFAVASATLVGQALGAGEPERATRAGWRSVRFAVAVSVVLGGLYAWARLPIARLFTDDIGVIQALDPFMLILALSQPLLALHFTLGGSLRGAGDTMSPMLASIFGNWVFRVPLAYLFARVLSLDIVWIWATLTADHLARCVWMVWTFRYGSWRERTGVDLG